MIIGPANDEQRRLFDHMVALQDVALAAIWPGTPCVEADRAVREYYEVQDLMPYWQHHAGYAIGLRYHQSPYLDVNDPTELRPGMVLALEPRLQREEWGGFRHFDTVVVTEEGMEELTYHPRALASLPID